FYGAVSATPKTHYPEDASLGGGPVSGGPESTTEQAPAWHTLPIGQACPQVPQFSGSLVRLTSQPSPTVPSQFAKPVAQLIPHTPTLPGVVGWGSFGRGAQAPPHVATSLFDTQAAPQRWKPLRQTNPHDAPSHVAIAFGGVAQGVHEEPHDCGLPLPTHALP